MIQVREIHWPEGPQPGDFHSEGGRTWEYVSMPPGSSVPGVWRDVGCKEATTGPGWTLDDIKNWLGIEGPEQDGQIQIAMKVIVSYVERYCNRLFEWRDNHRERVYKQISSGWQVHLWPISGEVYLTGDPVSFEVDNQTGILWFENESINHRMPEVLQFNGGYKPDEWPADLLLVMYNSIKNYWEASMGGGDTSDISKITVPDVGTITYATGSFNNAGIGLGADFGPVQAKDQIVLDFYRLHEC